MTTHARPLLVYALMVVVGAAAFLYPFWLPATAFSSQAHSGDAPLVAALVGALVIVAVALEVRRGTMNGATVAILGHAVGVRRTAAPVRPSRRWERDLLPRRARGRGLRSALRPAARPVLDGGVGHRHRRDRAVAAVPDARRSRGWAAWPGSSACGRRAWLHAPEVVVLAAYGWVWGFVYGAIMNLWFWPFARGGALDWHPGLGFGATLSRYWSFYVATSLGWDAAAAITNALLILVTGAALLRTLRRFAHRLEPAVTFVEPASIHPAIAGRTDASLRLAVTGRRCAGRCRGRRAGGGRPRACRRRARDRR